MRFRILKKILLTASAAVFALTATATPVVPLPTKVVAEAATMKISSKSLSLEVGDTYKLKVTGKGKKKVKWSSTNSGIASVSSSGNVKAVSRGNATIKAKVGGRTLKCKVKVNSQHNVSASYYNQLRNHINTYGSYSDLGEKQISYEMPYYDDPDMNDASVSLDITNESDGDISFTVYFSYFDDDDDLSSIYSSMNLSKNGKVSIIYVSLTAANIDAFTATAYNYDPSDYIKDVTDIDFEIENKTYGIISNSEIQEDANKLFAQSLEVFDAGLQKEVGFGLKELGFTYYY